MTSEEKGVEGREKSDDDESEKKGGGSDSSGGNEVGEVRQWVSGWGCLYCFQGEWVGMLILLSGSFWCKVSYFCYVQPI